MCLYEILKTLGKSEYVEVEQIRNKMNPRKITFRLSERDIYIEEYPLMQNGVLVPSYLCIDGTIYDLQVDNLICKDDLQDFGIGDLFGSPYEVIELLYEKYNRALESKISTAYPSVFKSIVSDNMEFSDLLIEDRKEEMKILLEGYIMFASMSGHIPWRNNKFFYWKSKKYPELIIFKDMIVGKGKSDEGRR